jgi:hypothetical protein
MPRVTELDSIRIIAHLMQIREENLYLIIFYLPDIYIKIRPGIMSAWSSATPQSMWPRQRLREHGHWQRHDQ